METKGPAEVAAEHASAVAREVVRAQLAELEPVKKVFAEYTDLVQKHGPKGTLTQLLLARGVIDRAGFDKLNGAVPPNGLAGTGASQVVRIPPGAVAAAPPRPSDRFSNTTPPSSASQVAKLPAASNASQVAKVPSSGRIGANASPNATLEYAEILPLDKKPAALVDDDGRSGPLHGSGEGTLEFDRVIPLRPPAPKVGDSGDSLGFALPSGFAGEAPSPQRTRTPPSSRTPARSGPSAGSSGSRDDAPRGIGTTADSKVSGSSSDPLELAPIDEPPPRPQPTDFKLSDDVDGDDPPGGKPLPAGTEPPSVGSDEKQTPVVAVGESSGEEREPQPGQVVGGYELLKVLGRGGMGVIFTSKKQGGTEIVALKCLLGGQDPGADRRRQRFRCEFEALRRLDHPNIIKVYDYGRHGAFDWYTMDYIEGKDFEKLLLENTLEHHERLAIYADICEAMAHAHERQVVHRDLKPQNVLVDKDGRGRVLDFGLAKILDQGVGMTRTGSSLGTPFYMAPEQLKSAKHIDARADVFALGVILYEVTVGVRPFLGETAAEVGQQILNTEPPRPTKAKKGLHPDIDAMCLKAMEKDAERRYPNAGALVEDLRRHRKGLGVEGAKGVQGAVGEARRWAERNRAALIGGGVVLAVMVPVLVVAIALGLSKNDAKPPGGTTTQPDEPEPGGKGGKTRPPATTTTTTQASPPGQTSAPRPATTAPPQTTAPAGATSAPPANTRPPAGTTSAPAGATSAPAGDTTPPTARSPEQLARLALVPPDESGPSAAERVKETLNQQQQNALVLGFDALVAPAMAAGDTDLAQARLSAMRAGDQVVVPAELGAQIDADTTTLRRLRDLVALRLREQLSRFTLDRVMGERPRGAPARVTDQGLVEVAEGGAPTGLVDPLSLDLAALRALVVTDPKADNAGVQYALAIVGAYRGLGEQALDKDFTAAGGAQAVLRRRAFVRWLEEARPAAANALTDGAAAAWTALKRPRRTDAQVLADLDEFLEEHGRSAEGRKRRDEWLQIMAEKRPLAELLHGQLQRGKPPMTWDPLSAERVLDLELAPLDEARAFKAEAQTRGVAMTNGRLALDLLDLVSWTGEATIGADKDEGLMSVILGPMTQEVDPDAAWTVKVDGLPAPLTEAKKRNMVTPRQLTFERREGDTPARVFHLGTAQLEVAEAQFRPRMPRDPVLAVQAAGTMRVTQLALGWTDADNEKDRSKRLIQRLVERRWLDRIGAIAVRHGDLLFRLDPSRPVGVSTAGAWAAREGAFVGTGGALSVLQWADVGVVRLQVAQDDGPGVRLHLRAGVAGPGHSWLLPQRIQTSGDPYRAVTVVFDAKAKQACAIVDGLRLRTASGPQSKVPARVNVAIEPVGRTQVQVKDLELWQLGQRTATR